MLSCLLFVGVTQVTAPELRAWGFDTIEQIRRELYLSPRRLYAESTKVGAPPAQPAFHWPAGVQLSALNAAARLHKKYLPWAVEYGEAMRAYWRPAEQAPEVAGRRLGGFDVLPLPKESDRYYDDNAWFVLAYAETFEISGDPRFLRWAEEAFEFVMSGWDESLGGGIYWRESDRASKNTCSNAPSAAGALELYRLTGQKRYLQDALRIYAWTKAHLQDPSDGLMWDALANSGRIDRTKWTYNTALMIRSATAIADLLPPTQASRYRQDARRMIESAIGRWGRPGGAIACDAAFAHLLTEAILLANKTERSQTWRDFVLTTLGWLRSNGRDRLGRYPKRWNQAPGAALEEVHLMHQASAARAYLYAAFAADGAG